MEFQSAKLYCEVLAKEGFTVETPIAGIETAFKASYGSGKPVIGILAEYDALTGLSQQAGAVERKELVSGGCGHGCGHNMLGAGSLAAAFAIKKYLEDGHTGHRHLLWLSRRRGRRCQSLYGARPHLGGAGRCFDLAPGRCQPGHLRHLHTCIQTEYKFTGSLPTPPAVLTCRSALDAVELMNVGVQFLREHMRQRQESTTPSPMQAATPRT